LGAGTFGSVVPISGHAADLALDEARGLVYLANYTASQVEVISTATLARRTAMPVASQPSSLALSPDGRYLLVVHNANYQPPATAYYGLTVIRLDTGLRQTVVLPSPPLGVAFTCDNRALVATATEFLRYDPASGALAVVATIEELAVNSLPAPPASLPPAITAASLAASRDGEHIYGLTDTLYFRFDRYPQRLPLSRYVSAPAMGPRAVSVSRDGSYFAAGWAVFDQRGTLTAQFAGATGQLDVGGHAIDSDRGLIFAQVPRKEGEAPVLVVADADNLAVRERLRLPEDLAGKAVLSSDGSRMYAISSSGLTVLPVGAWQTQKRLTATAESVLFQAGFCQRAPATQEIFLVDAAGGAIDYSISGGGPGLTVWPSNGTTPAAVQLRFAPEALANQQGTVEYTLTLPRRRRSTCRSRCASCSTCGRPTSAAPCSVCPASWLTFWRTRRATVHILRQDANQILATAPPTTA
jgi:6-phosphogluconolactonase (cycloisomerase 2 family)